MRFNESTFSSDFDGCKKLGYVLLLVMFVAVVLAVAFAVEGAIVMLVWNLLITAAINSAEPITFKSGVLIAIALSIIMAIFAPKRG